MASYAWALEVRPGYEEKTQTIDGRRADLSDLTLYHLNAKFAGYAVRIVARS
jgi:hypothetical protein